MKNLWQEFKSFAFKGNMIDLAVGVIIGAAFGSVIKSLVQDIMMPVIGAIVGSAGSRFGGLSFTINGSTIRYGNFIGEMINFLLVALAIFIVIVKIVSLLVKKAEPAPAPSEPTVKECPHCLSEIPLKAHRCKFCTTELG